VTQALFVSCAQALKAGMIEPAHDADKSPDYCPEKSDSRPMAVQLCRQSGNRHFKLGQYKEATAEYSEGLLLDPRDHRLWCCRAACHAAQKQWSECWGDARHAVQLEPTFTRGWLLFAKALWKDDMPVIAKQVLSDALRALPGCAELLALNAEIDRCRGNAMARSSSSVVCGKKSASLKKCPSLSTPTARTSSLFSPKEAKKPGEEHESDSPDDRTATPNSSSTRSSPCTTSTSVETYGRCFPRASSDLLLAASQ